MHRFFVLLLTLLLFIFPQATRTQNNLLGLGIDKYKDLYLVDASTGLVHHYDSETGIYLGLWPPKGKSLTTESVTDITVCACGGAIALLDEIDNRIVVVDYEGNFMWQKGNDMPSLPFKNPNAIGICQDSDYEHVILTTQTGEVFHVSPPNLPDKQLKDNGFKNPRGVYMDFIKQVFICDYDNGRVVKTKEWGDFVMDIGKGVLQKPTDVATSEDNDRRIWVADQGTSLLHCFSENGKHLFDCGKGIISNPQTVVVDYLDSSCYVAENVNGEVLIHKFDKDGVYIFTIRHATNLNIQKLLRTKLGSYVLEIRGGQTNSKLLNPSKLVEGEIFVELRTVSEDLGFAVSWNSSLRMATINANDDGVLSVDQPNSIATYRTRDNQKGSNKIKIQPKVYLSKNKLMIPMKLFELLNVTVHTFEDNVFFVNPKLESFQNLPKPDIGKELFQTKCSHCHNPPSPDGKTRDEWPPVVKRMMSKDTTWINETEADRIARYLWGQGKPDKIP